MKLRILALLPAIVVALGACSKKADPSPVPKVSVQVAATNAVPEAHSDDVVHWRRGDVDAAFAEAKAAGKPVFLTGAPAALVELSVDDAARSEKVAGQVIGEVEPSAASFEGRNRKSLSKLAPRLAAWNANGDHAAEAVRIAAASRALCDRVPTDTPDRGRCGELLKVGSAMAKPTA